MKTIPFRFLATLILLAGRLMALPPELVDQVHISLLSPSQTAPDLPPQQLTLLLRAPSPLYYKLDLPDRTLASGRLIPGSLPVGLSWNEMEKIGRVPLTLSVMDQDRVSRREFCLIFSTVPAPVDVDGTPLPGPKPASTASPVKPQLTFESRTDKRFEQLLKEIRATPAPERPYGLIDPKTYGRISLNPVNLLFLGAVYLAHKILSKKPEALSEVLCSYNRRLETGQQWVTIRVSLINQALPESR